MRAAAAAEPGPRQIRSCGSAVQTPRSAAAPTTTAARPAALSSLLLEHYAEQPFGPDQQHQDHDRQRHRALEVGTRRNGKHGDGLDITDDESADQAALP